MHPRGPGPQNNLANKLKLEVVLDYSYVYGAGGKPTLIKEIFLTKGQKGLFTAKATIIIIIIQKIMKKKRNGRYKKKV